MFCKCGCSGTDAIAICGGADATYGALWIGAGSADLKSFSFCSELNTQEATSFIGESSKLRSKPSSGTLPNAIVILSTPCAMTAMNTAITLPPSESGGGVPGGIEREESKR